MIVGLWSCGGWSGWRAQTSSNDVEAVIEQNLVGKKPVEALVLDDEDFERSKRGPKEVPPSG